MEFIWHATINRGRRGAIAKVAFKPDLAANFNNWSNGSVIRVACGLIQKGLREQGLAKTESYIEDTGEVNWLVQDAINKEIPIPVISQSIMELFKSRMTESDASTNRSP